jgi:hypothetical protein
MKKPATVVSCKDTMKCKEFQMLCGSDQWVDSNCKKTCGKCPREVKKPTKKSAAPVMNAKKKGGKVQKRRTTQQKIAKKVAKGIMKAAATGSVAAMKEEIKNLTAQVNEKDGNESQAVQPCRGQKSCDCEWQ